MNAVEVRNVEIRAVAPAEDARYARAVLLRDAQARRNVAFASDAELFGDPAWEILLALYVAGRGRGSAALTDLTLSPQLPPTTAARHLQELRRRGLVEPDGAADAAFRLSARGRATLDGCFAG